MREYRVDHVTPYGAWIKHGTGLRFVNLVANKKFACTTPESALASYIARKHKEASIYKARMQRAHKALDLGLAKAGLPTKYRALSSS